MTEIATRIAEVKREIRARSMDGIERRFVGPGSLAGYSNADPQLETRDVPSGGWQVRGYGMVFNSWSEDLGGFRERIRPGAADEVLANNPDIRGLINHNPDLILGRTVAGTMTVASDSNGVHYEIAAPDTSYANDLRVSLDRRDITQSSFAFRIASGGVEWTEDPESGLLLRTVTKFSGLFDMSPVTYPAYPASSAGAHSSPTDAERDGDESSAGQRTEDGGTEESQADADWRLKDVQRRMALRETA